MIILDQMKEVCHRQNKILSHSQWERKGTDQNEEEGWEKERESVESYRFPSHHSLTKGLSNPTEWSSGKLKRDPFDSVALFQTAKFLWCHWQNFLVLRPSKNGDQVPCRQVSAKKKYCRIKTALSYCINYRTVSLTASRLQQKKLPLPYACSGHESFSGKGPSALKERKTFQTKGRRRRAFIPPLPQPFPPVLASRAARWSGQNSDNGQWKLWQWTQNSDNGLKKWHKCLILAKTSKNLPK